MIIPCPSKIDCPDTSYPLSNYSSEAPDPPIFIRAPKEFTVNFFGGGAGGPIPPPDGGPTPESMSYNSTYGCVGDPYLQLFNFGGIEPITFDVVEGIIPSWIAADVSGQTLTLTGTPSDLDAGTSSFTIRATDAIGETQTKQFTADIMGLISGTTLPQFSNGSPYAQTLASVGGAGGYTYGISDGALPAGVLLSPAGLISGTPIVDTGTFPFTLTIRDAAGRLCHQDMQFESAVPQTCNLTTICDSGFPKRYRIVGYFDSMFTGNGILFGGPLWDGTFTSGQSDTCGSQPLSCKFVTGNRTMHNPDTTVTTINAQVGYDQGFWDTGSNYTPPTNCIPWFLCIINFLGGFFPVTVWRGVLTGSEHSLTGNVSCPVGVFTRINGYSAGPATVTIEEYQP